MTTAIPQQFEASDAGKTLAGFGRALAERSLEEPLKAAANDFRGGVWGNFMRAEGPTGGKWPPRVDRMPHPLLIKTGKMLNAATDGSASGAVTEIGPRDALLGIDDAAVHYAKYHMSGTSRMPARPYYYAGSSVLDSMAETMASETMRLLLP